jgi:hypothetical protein
MEDMGSPVRKFWKRVDEASFPERLGGNYGRAWKRARPTTKAHRRYDRPEVVPEMLKLVRPGSSDTKTPICQTAAESVTRPTPDLVREPVEWRRRMREHRRRSSSRRPLQSGNARASGESSLWAGARSCSPSLT